ncbi:hypothetical protein G7B40_032805 [Aetokthonos hydrillicola Thurmond2011]|jgi:hypothetical protein|uniref:Uncharacterized protein n=1 Tax=Aetokthonos hydrillicola Thurmond2011 TaxID=2712845 RepID=A0AAP5IFP0_9CYAN|nr:hypothetical protein [Aetokthonos hydrillicola]MBW4585804.1 hypothetical protein [Aetokthonos hydrillicola CCALA 1050]MDR9899307.1 hypothetical protein [Aetokthonos hydrillicola Thurmond2011]
MIQLLKSPLKIVVWFAAGLICVAIAVPLIHKALKKSTESHQVSIHTLQQTNLEHHIG